MPAVSDYLYGQSLKQNDTDIFLQKLIELQINRELYQSFGLFNTDQLEIKLQPVLLQKLAPGEFHNEAGEEPFYELSVTLRHENIRGANNPKTYADTVTFFLMNLAMRTQSATFVFGHVQLFVAGKTPADILFKLGYKDIDVEQIAQNSPELNIKKQIVRRPIPPLVSDNGKPIKPAP